MYIEMRLYWLKSRHPDWHPIISPYIENGAFLICKFCRLPLRVWRISVFSQLTCKVSVKVSALYESKWCWWANFAVHIDFIYLTSVLTSYIGTALLMTPEVVPSMDILSSIPIIYKTFVDDLSNHYLFRIHYFMPSTHTSQQVPFRIRGHYGTLVRL